MGADRCWLCRRQGEVPRSLRLLGVVAASGAGAKEQQDVKLLTGIGVKS